MEKIGIGIAGGTGYGAHELLRLLAGHEHCQVCTISSRSEAGNALSSFHTDLTGIYDLTFEEQLNIESLSNFKRQVVFTALPHGTSIAYIENLLSIAPDIQIIDLSGDLRLKSEQVHQQHYADTPFTKDIREQFVFGLTELNRKAIAEATHVSNPGCYPTASSLALAPLARQKLIAGSVVVNAGSGTSGAGRSPGVSTHHPQRNVSVTAYKALSHRHEAEIHQALGSPNCTDFSSMFVPHLLPISRGIYISAYTELSEELSQNELLELYRKFYAQDSFIRILDDPPELAHVIGSNYCDISLATRGKQIVLFAAEDNLIKGMAGQAIQNLNVMLGLPEETGLQCPPLGIL